MIYLLVALAVILVCSTARRCAGVLAEGIASLGKDTSQPMAICERCDALLPDDGRGAVEKHETLHVWTDSLAAELVAIKRKLNE